MKKTIVLLAGLFTLVSSAFAFSIGNRFIEVRATVPFGLSNNGISLNDIMKKEAVFDLNSIKDSVGKDGLKFNLFAKPEVDLNLRFGPNASVFFQTGVDANLDFGLTRETLALLAEGNPDGGPLSGGLDAGGDVFAFFRVPVAFKVQDLELSFTPAVFVPVAHAVTENATVTVVNDEDGTFTVKGNASASIYSAANKKLLNDPNGFTMEQVMDQAGFDFAVGGKYAVLKNLKVTANVLCPVLPGKLVSKATVTGSVEMSKNLMDSSKDSEMVTNYTNPVIVDLEEAVSIYRPMEVMAGVEFNLTPGILVDGSVGCAIKNPFTAESKFLLQYAAGIDLNLANILGVNARTSLKNGTYSHTAGFMFNLRLVELDAGVSLSGTSLPASFTMKGLGAYVTVCVGI